MNVAAALMVQAGAVLCCMAGPAGAQGLVASPRLRTLDVTQPGEMPGDAAADMPGRTIHLSDDLPVDREALQAELAGLLDRPIGRDVIADIRRVLTQRFVASGHPFIDIEIPPQDITDGHLRVVLRQYRVGQVLVSGNDWYSDRQITEAAALVPGQTIDKTGLDARLAAFGASPFVKVTPEFKPGGAPGTTDVTLLVADRLPVQASAAYRDHGAAATGWDRFDLGVRWGNAFQTGGTLGYTLSSSSDFYTGRPGSDLLGDGAPPRFLSHQLMASLPLAGGTRISLSGAYTRQSPSLGPDLGSIGTTTQLSADVTRPVEGVLSWLGAYGEEIGVAADFKRTNNNLSFGGVQVQRGFTVIGQISLHIGAMMETALGRLQMLNTLTASPGGLSPENTDRAFQPAGLAQSGTPGARARYAYDRLVLSQLTPLPQEYGLVLRATMQAASGTLLGSEQMSIAGMDAVRGYQEFGVAGSQGVLLSAELHTPGFSPSGLVGLQGYADQAQLHVFADAGRAWNPVSSQTAPAAQSTASLGVGATLALADRLNLRLEQGWQLIRSNRQGAKGAFLHAEVTATW